MFLSVNGFDFQPDRADLLITVTKLAAGETGEEELAGWIAANSKARS
jgi:prophage maintenance system killer protein